MREEMGYEAYKTVSNNFSIEKQIKIFNTEYLKYVSKS